MNARNKSERLFLANLSSLVYCLQVRLAPTQVPSHVLKSRVSYWLLAMTANIRLG